MDYFYSCISGHYCFFLSLYFLIFLVYYIIILKNFLNLSNVNHLKIIYKRKFRTLHFLLSFINFWFFFVFLIYRTNIFKSLYLFTSQLLLQLHRLHRLLYHLFYCQYMKYSIILRQQGIYPMDY